MSSETTAGDAAGNYTVVRTFTATDDAETALRPADHHGTGHLALVHLRPTDYTASAPTRCPWTTPRRLTLQQVTIRCRRRSLAMLRATTPSFARSRPPTR